MVAIALSPAKEFRAINFDPWNKLTLIRGGEKVNFDRRKCSSGQFLRQGLWWSGTKCCQIINFSYSCPSQLLLFSVSAWLPNCTICVSVIKGGWLDSGKSSWKEEKNIFLGVYGLSLNTFFIASMTLRHASVRSVSWQNRLPVSAKLLLLPWPDSCEVEVCLCRDGRPMGFQCKFAATIIHNGELCALWNELWWHVILKDTKY